MTGGQTGCEPIFRTDLGPETQVLRLLDHQASLIAASATLAGTITLLLSLLPGI